MWLRSRSGEIYLRPTDLLVAIDETGDEELRMPNYPVFGIGCCATLVGHARGVIDIPWTRMKAQHFGDATERLHAAEMPRRKPSQLQLNSIGDFFRQHDFFRFAAVVTEQTNLSLPEARYGCLAYLLRRYLCMLHTVLPFTGATLLFESSDRLDPLTARVFRERSQ
jgi:hypothetical protein